MRSSAFVRQPLGRTGWSSPSLEGTRERDKAVEKKIMSEKILRVILEIFGLPMVVSAAAPVRYCGIGSIRQVFIRWRLSGAGFARF